MQRTKYTTEQRTEALQLLAAHGKAEAARRTGIPEGTISSWGSRHDVQAPPVEAVRAASEAAVASVGQRKAKLAEGLLADAERLRLQLFAPVIEKQVVTEKLDGPNAGSQARIVDVKLSRPKPSDQRQMMTAIAIAVDKVQILTGEATQRIEQLTAGTEPIDRRTRALAVVHDIAARRAG